jgi:succinoglycan biosynthesis transport protein ExoP
MSDDASLPVVRPRRGPRVIGYLFLVALVGGFIFWLVKPDTATATALFEVRMDTPSLVGNQAAQGQPETNFEILKKTQIALIQSKFLLTAALRNPSVGGSPVFAGVRDHEEWLQEHLEVNYPQNGEILAISLRGPKSQANELRMIVDAVAEAYKTEVLGAEKSRQLNQRDMLERSLQNLNGEIKRKYEDYLDIAKGLGQVEGSTGIQQQLDTKRLDRIDEELAQLERELLKIEIGGDAKESKFFKQRMAQLTKRQEELLKTVEKRGQMSVELTTRKNELGQLQVIANDLSAKLEKMDIESQLPSRIRQVQQAVIDDGKIARQ